ncbi:RNA polymerase subunit sigma [Bradyrhizobium sp. CCBAU 051011]|jgi:RNA polymerase sigma-70 factor, ECF subfamily|uniref:sigma-70 family RNA polymerase sigma factor n=1 Tax=Bradyrhizobium sp. CCBAU 051011 TaxID=858422 RepID=UPI00137440D3|nr:sigma-70 family RNA polymerase sigma factor [Bradyrhizobium sp. CCBAU 051011]QHO73562.1 RNA polymerase subunit sigma [Bradyrhizobium sp. CCBAU 051011]
MRQISEDDLGQVLRSVAKGDRAAFRQLYEQAGPTLFGICSRILRDRNAAEDAFQEAMLRIWQKSYLYDAAKGGAMSWMVTVTRRVVLDRLPVRRSGPVSLTDESVMAVLEALSNQAPHDPALAPDLRKCLGLLDQNYRQSVLLAYYYGLSYEELAAHSAVPVGTIRTWIHRAVEKLQLCLSQ